MSAHGYPLRSTTFDSNGRATYFEPDTSTTFTVVSHNTSANGCPRIPHETLMYHVNGTRGVAIWNPRISNNGRWDVVHLDSGPYFGKVLAINEISNYWGYGDTGVILQARPCDVTGTNVYDRTIACWMSIPRGTSPAVWEGNVVALSDPGTNIGGPHDIRAVVVSSLYGPKIGTIQIWSGLLTNIPKGWVLCDGTYPTPDLRHRFVMGIDTATGARSDESSIGSVGGTRFNTATQTLQYSSTGSTAVLPDAYETNPSLENRPPYYVLAYIMRYG